MKQSESNESPLEKHGSDIEKSIEYDVFISCLAEIIIVYKDDKDIDKHFI